ncbi:hypothetical protein [Litorilituus lipolyticus]|uniref:Uncharacterized protein n=1 Tax=Litorilituus lipolyticus TaxID=2491017 RepID=A0A502L5Q6_9GAMM|nr:hypothetical protein [Litorilituus lipolyticus]TPH19268.1 hypothetical protein EPA86_00650 [Litorilituus lipolyticus]
MNKVKNYTTVNQKNTKKLMFWTAAWVISMAIAAFAPRFIWDFNTTLTIIGVLLNIAAGLGMLLANRQYLIDLDEMQRKIMLEAMGLTLGVGLVFGLSYELFEDIKLINSEPEISHVVIVMAITYLIANIKGHRKYQ